MYIKSISIENFGNFHKQNFNFSEGLNSLIQENGWGKSTVAAFIKAMLYGMDEKGRKKGFFERERYFPWSGGKFGGSMEFSHDGKDFKITRFFDASKKSLDTMEVKDLASKLSAKEFEGTNEPGLVMFGIDRDSFERSCFVTLDKEKVPGLNDNINAKLNNLIDDSDDIGNYEDADALLLKYINNYKAARGGGIIKNFEDQIEQCKESLNSISTIEASSKKIIQIMEELEQKRKEKLLEKNSLETEKENVLLYDRKKTFDAMLNRKMEFEEKKQNFLELFNGKEPDEKLIQELNNKNNLLNQLKSEKIRYNVTENDRLRFEELKKFFAGDIPEFDEIENCQKNINRKNECLKMAAASVLDEAQKEKYRKFQIQFSNVQISDEFIQEQLLRINSFQKNETELAQKNVELKSAEEKIEESKKIVWTGLLSGGILAVAGIVFVLFFNKIPHFLAVVAACFMSAFVVFVLAVKKSHRKQHEKNLEKIKTEIDELAKKIDADRTACLSFIKSIHPDAVFENAQFELSKIQSEFSEYSELIKKSETYKSLTADNKELSELENDIKAFTVRYEVPCGVKEEDKILAIVRSRLQAYENLVGIIPRYDSICQEVEKLTQDLLSQMAVFNINHSDSLDQQINSLQSSKFEYKNLKGNLDAVFADIAEFERSNNMEQIHGAKETSRTLEQLNSDLERISKDIIGIGTDFQQYKDKLTNNEIEIDRRSDYESQIDQLNENLMASKRQYEVLSSAREYLREAYDNLSNRYMGKMESAFSGYVENLAGSKEISIDRNLGVSLQKDGLEHSTEYFSEGYKDLVNFCTRMALVDAMFAEERPVLVLDDPFVNLDEEKINKARILLEKIAEKKQILYFSCHDSRKV